MSTRTALTVLNQGALPELGPDTKTLETLDVTNGNKLPFGADVVMTLINTSVASKTVTYTYTERGETRTKVLTLAAGEIVVAGPFDPLFGVHAGDAENGTHVWLTANGSSGDVKGRATRLHR